MGYIIENALKHIVKINHFYVSGNLLLWETIDTEKDQQRENKICVVTSQPL